MCVLKKNKVSGNGPTDRAQLDDIDMWRKCVNTLTNVECRLICD